jgi:hypothetical protein
VNVPESSLKPGVTLEKGGATTMRKNLVDRFRVLAGACVMAALPAIGPAEAKAPDFGVRGGVYPDEDEAFLGAEALFGVGGTRHWFGNPNLEHAFADDGGVTALSFDFHYDFPGDAPYTLWAGAGPTLIRRDRNGPRDDDSTDAGVNLLLGLGARKGEVRPYGQVKLVLADDSAAILGVGVRF